MESRTAAGTDHRDRPAEMGDEQIMREPDDDTLLFFDAHRYALPLFAVLE